MAIIEQASTFFVCYLLCATPKSVWKLGILEWWNNGVKVELLTRLLDPIFQYSSVPVFQHL
jgi:hypothetical protein